MRCPPGSLCPPTRRASPRASRKYSTISWKGYATKKLPASSTSASVLSKCTSSTCCTNSICIPGLRPLYGITSTSRAAIPRARDIASLTAFVRLALVVTGHWYYSHCGHPD